MPKILASVMCVLALTASLPTRAAPVTWSLQNAVFDDGGTAFGSFVFDAATNAYSSVNLTTTAGSVAAGASYTSAFPLLSALSLQMIDSAPFVIGASFRFSLAFAAPGLASTSAVPIVGALEIVCVTPGCGTVGGSQIRRDFRAGASVVPLASQVPEPGTLALVGLAMAALVGGRWLRERHGTQALSA